MSDNDETWQLALVVDNCQSYLQNAIENVGELSALSTKAKVQRLMREVLRWSSDTNPLNEDARQLRAVDFNNVDWAELVAHYQVKFIEQKRYKETLNAGVK